MRKLFKRCQQVIEVENEILRPSNSSRFWNSSIVYSVSLAMVFNPVVSNAGVAVDGASPASNQASVSSAGNGVPIVDIVAPTAKGVSHNKFNQFDVDAQGLILNNSRSLVDTQLAGGIDANPNLTANTASIILNEVTSANRSILNGLAEVAGQSAEFVLANPNGITCSGCGFINTPRATLTTGVPSLLDGRLEGFSVNDGDIAINGLNASSIDRMDLFARAITLNDKLHANQLNIVTGRNDINYSNLSVTAKTTNGSDQPAFALDVAALGGMYANQIFMVGTEAGLGVNIQGEMASNAGDISLKADGTLSLSRVIAGKNLALESTGSNIEILGTTYSKGDSALIAVQGNLTNNGNLIAETGLTVTADNLTNSHTGKIQSFGVASVQLAKDFNNQTNGSDQGAFTADGALTLTAENISNNGILGGGDTVTLTARNALENSAAYGERGSVLFAVGSLSLYGQTIINRQSNIFGLENIVMAGDASNSAAQSIRNSSSTLESFGNLTITANEFVNHRQGMYGIDNEAYCDTDSYFCGAPIADLGYDYGFEFGDTLRGAWLVEELDRFVDLDWSRSWDWNDENSEVRRVYQALVDRILPASKETEVIVGQDFNLLAGAFRNEGGLVSVANDLRANVTTFSNASSIAVMPAPYGWSEHGEGWLDRFDSDIYRSDYALHQLFFAGLVTVGNNLAVNAVEEIHNGASTYIDPVPQTVPDLPLPKAPSSGNADDSITDQLDLTVANPFASFLDLPPGSDFDRVEVEISLPSAGGDASTGGGGLFTFTKPAVDQSNTLIATTSSVARFVSVQGSEYLLNLLGLDPDETTKRLGDGFYESRLIRKAIHNNTGNRFLHDSFVSDAQQYRYLMESAANAAKDLQLSVGVALTHDQIRNLTNDMVWLVEKEINGETVLVPTLYLAQVRQDSFGTDGTTIIAKDIILNSGGDITNVASISAKQNLSLQAKDNIKNVGGNIEGQNIAIISDKGDFLHTTNGDRTAYLVANKGLLVRAGRDISFLGTDVRAGDDSQLIAGRDLNLKSTKAESDYKSEFYWDDDAPVSASFSTVEKSNHAKVNIAGSALIRSGRDLNVEGAELEVAGNAALDVGQDFKTKTQITKSTLQVYGNGEEARNYTASESHQTSNVSIQGDGSITTGRDFNLKGSKLAIDGSAQLNLGRDLNLESETNKGTKSVHLKYTEFEEEPEEERKISSVHARSEGKKKLQSIDVVTSIETYREQSATLNVGENLTADLGGDINLVASNIAVDGTADVAVDGSINLTSKTDRQVSETAESETYLHVVTSDTSILPSSGSTNSQQINSTDIHSTGTARLTSPRRIFQKNRRAARYKKVTSTRFSKSEVQLENHRSSISVSDDVQISAKGNIDNAQGRVLLGDGAISLDGSLANRDGAKILSKENLSIRTGKGIVNDRAQISAETIVLETKGDFLNRNAGAVTGEKSTELLVQGTLENRGGSRLSLGDAAIRSDGDIINTESSTIQGNTLLIESGSSIVNQDGSLIAGDDVALIAKQDVINERTVTQSKLERPIENGRKRGFLASFLGNAKERVITTDISEESTVNAEGDLTVVAGRDIQNTASRISAGGHADLSAGRDIKLHAVADRERVASSGNIKDDLTHTGAELSADDDLTLIADDNIEIYGSQITTGGDLALNAKGDVDIKSVADEHYRYKRKTSKSITGKKKKVTEFYKTTNIASQLNAKQDVSIASTFGNVALQGSAVNAGGDVNVAAGGQVSLESAQEIDYFYQKKSSSSFGGLKSSSSTSKVSKLSQVGTHSKSAGDTAIVSAGDVNIVASRVDSDQDIDITAGASGNGDINIVSLKNRKGSFYEKKSSGLGLSLDAKSISIASETTKGKSRTQFNNQASELNAEGRVGLDASRDVNVVGSEISAVQNIDIDATRDVNLLAASERDEQSRWKSESKLGISWDSDGNGVSVFAGKETLKEQNTEEALLSAGTTLKAGNDVAITSQRDIKQLGGSTEAGRDIRYKAGEKLDLVADTESFTSTHTQEQTKTGLGVNFQHNFDNAKQAVENLGNGDNTASKVSGVLRAVDQVSQTLSGPQVSTTVGRSSSDSAATTVKGIAKGSALEAGRNIALSAGESTLLEGTQAKAKGNLTIAANDVSIEAAHNALVQKFERKDSWVGIRQQGRSIGVGASNGNRDSSTNQTSSQAASLQAGNNLAVVANDDIAIKGSDLLGGNNLTLDAGDDISITAGQQVSIQRSQSRSGGGEIGITAFEEDGFGIYVQGNAAKSNLDRNDSTNRNSQLQAGNTLAVNSGGNTEIAGANLAAEHLYVDVKGDLTVASVQDAGNVSGDRRDLSGRVTVGSGVSLSGSYGKGETNGDKRWVGQQTSLIGRESVDITTGSHTQIDGALIANIDESGKDAGNLSLTTESLGFSDIKDQHKEESDYTRVSVGWESQADAENSAQDRGPNSGYSQSTQLPTSDETGTSFDNRTTGGVEGSYSSLDREQINRATVGKGAITVARDQRTGDDSTDGLNRDVTAAQEITKDEQEATDLYATESSVENTVDLFKKSETDDYTTPDNDESRQNTIDKWTRLTSDYGNNTGESLEDSAKFVKNLGEIATDILDEIRVQTVSLDEVDSSLKESLGNELALDISRNSVRLNGRMLTDREVAVLAKISGTLGKARTVANNAVTLRKQIVPTPLDSDLEGSATDSSDSTEWSDIEEVTVLETSQYTYGEKFYIGANDVKEELEELPQEELAIATIGIQAAFGPAKAIISSTGGYLAEKFFGEEVAQATENVAVKSVDLASDNSNEEDVRDAHEYKKSEDSSGLEKGDSRVEGAEFVIAVVIGVGLSKLGSKRGEGDDSTEKLGSDTTPGIHQEANNGSFDAEGDFGPLNQRQRRDTLGQHEELKDTYRRSMNRPATSGRDPTFERVLNDNYRENSTVGSGSTADAVRHETLTGEQVGGVWHRQKAENTVDYLRDWLNKNKNNPNVPQVDKSAAKNVLVDLEKALNIKGD